MSTFDKFKVPLALGAAAATAAVGFVTLRRMGTAKSGANVAAMSAKDITSLEEDDVLALQSSDVARLLAGLRVSNESVEIFTQNDVDGAILLQLQPGHLEKMGVKRLADRMRISEFIRRYVECDDADENDADDEDDEVVMARALREQASRSPSKRKTGAAPAAQAVPAASAEGTPQDAERLEQITKIVVEKLRALYELFASKDFQNAPRDKQLEVVSLAKDDLKQIVEVIRNLPPEIGAKLLPLANNLAEVIEKVSSALNQVADAEEERGAAPDDEVDAGQLATMLKHFHTVLESEDLKNASEEDRQEALGSIANQLDKVEQLTAYVPERQQQPLRSLTSALKAMCTHLQGRGQKETGSRESSPQVAETRMAAQHANVQHASFQFISQRYRALFEGIRADSVLAAAPLERRKIIAQFRKEHESLAKEAALLPPEQAQVNAQISELVGQVLDQIDNMTNTELQAEAVENGEEAPQEADTDEAEPPITEEQTTRVMQTVAKSLTEIVSAIRSDSFIEASPEMRESIIKLIGERLNATVALIGRLPNAEREAISPMATQVIELVSLASKATVSQAQAGVEQSAAAPSADAASGKDDTSAEFTQVVANMKEMFAVIKSDKYKAADPAARMETSVSLMQHMQKIVPVIQSLENEQEQKTCAKLAGSLMELLKHSAEAAKTELSKAVEDASASASRVEEVEDDDEEASPDASAIVAKLTQLFNFIQTDKFTNAPPLRQRALGEAILSEITQVRQDAAKLDAATQETLTPLIDKLEESLSGYVKHIDAMVERVQAESKAENGGEDEDEDADEEDDEAREAVFEKAHRVTKMLDDGVINSADQLRDIMELMDDVDKQGIRNQQEIDIRQAFHTSLMNTMKKIEEEQSAVQVTDETGQMQITPAMQHFLAQFRAIGRELKDGGFSSRVELAPFIEVVEESINAAEEAGLDWKAHQLTVSTVGDVLQRIKQIEETLPEEDESSIGAVLDKARGEVEALDNSSPPEKILPYIKLLEKVAEMEDSLTINDLKALQKLQEAIIAAGDRVDTSGSPSKSKSGASSKNASPSKSSPSGGSRPAATPSPSKHSPSKSASSAASAGVTPMGAAAATPASPMSVAQPRVPPNTPAVARGAGSPSSNGGSAAKRALVTELGAMADEEEEEVEEQTEAQEGADDATVLSLLLQMAKKLSDLECDGCCPDDLMPYEMVLARVSQGELSEDLQQAVNVVRHLIAEKKASMDLGTVEAKRQMMAKLISILSHERFGMLPHPNKMSAVNEARQLVQSLDSAESVQLDTEVTQLLGALDKIDTGDVGQEEVVKGATLSDISLLPRVMERLQEEDFTANTTLFEIKSIDRLLRKLGESSIVVREKEIANMVRATRLGFADRIENSGEVMKDPTQVMCPMELTGQSTEDDNSNTVIRSLLYSAEESEDFTVNDRHLKMFEQKPMPVATPGDETLEKWGENSVALIVSIPAYEEGASAQNETILSEAAALHHLLDENFGFDVESFVSPITKNDFIQALAEVTERQPRRLMIYLQSVPSPHTNGQHAITFNCGEMMTYREIIETVGTDKIGHGCVIHDSVQTLELVSVLDGQISPNLGVSLSDGAFSVSNTSRCWLYDGLFTPIVLEQLLRVADSENDALCPEDIVNNAISVLSGRQLENGSYVQDNALAGPFLLPCEVDDDEDEE